MKKSFKSIKNNKLKLGMIFLVFSMSIGFATLNTNLKFSGIGRFVHSIEDDFRIYISRAFLNDVGKSNIISEDKNSITFSYTDINHRDADLKYTIKNTSRSYYADVEVSCKARKKDGTKFLYDEDNYISKKLRVEPGKSLTSNLQVLLPETTTPSTSGVENINLASYIQSLSEGSDSDINFNKLNESGVYESTNTDSGETIYYYRGTNANVENYVLFAERCWRILRTTETGGVRLIYSGIPNGNSCLTQGAFLGVQDETIEVNSATKYNDNAYAGYMYGSLNASDYSSAHQNSKDSVFKSKLDNWYKNTILNTEYEQYIIDDVYYNDRAVLRDYSNINSDEEYEGLGYGKYTTLYESSSRASSMAINLSPTYMTPSLDDSFTVSDAIGNGALTYPVSTLTADELVYAGATKSGTASWLYLYNRLLLTMSPVGYYDGTMNFVTQNEIGRLDIIPSDSSESLYILPTITISADLNILSGDGNNSNPFVLSSEDIYENTYTCTLNIERVGYSKDIEARNPLMDLEVGEEYCFEDECFYTISNDKRGTVKLLAKYNLYVGNIYTSSTKYTTISTSDSKYGKQHYTAIAVPADPTIFPYVGTVPYGKNTTDNSYANSVAKTYVDAYGEYMRELTGINMSASLITRDELLKLGCVATSDVAGSCSNPDFDWVNSTTYWTMTPANGTVFIVGADGYFSAPASTKNLTNGSSRGIRPVITISYASKNPDVTFVSGDGESVGDELCIGEECFYVLDYDGVNYTLFAKYNLYVGNIYTSGTKHTTITPSDPLYGKQNSLAIADKIGSGIYPRVGTLSYNDSVTEINNYADYINNTFNMHVTGRPISTDELVNTIGCTIGFTNNHGCNPTENPSVKYSWVINTTYWGSATSDTKAYIVGGQDGYFASVDNTSSSNRGARPVIVVPANEIKSPDYIVPSAYPSSWDDNGIFSAYYDKAYKTLKTMNTSEKVGQLLTMSYSASNPSGAEAAVQNYHVGGVLFFADAFTGKTEAQVKAMTSGLQSKAKIPLAMSVDEEGGTVTRIARNTNLVSNEIANYPNLFKTYSTSSYNAFKSPSDLYADSGNNFNLIKQETVVKSGVLKRLGLNVNFAPVLDISSSTGYMYNRTLKQDAEKTGEFAKAVIDSSKEIPGVTYTFKHFPGYGNNVDTHTGSATDTTSLADLKAQNIYPFAKGIQAGAQAIMINHNVYTSIDSTLPASLSPTVHDMLFNELNFTGVAVTDDLSMQAIGERYPNQYLKAFKAGNHVILTSTSYATAHSEILAAVNSGEISMDELNERVFKVLAWKYYNGWIS